MASVTLCSLVLDLLLAWSASSSSCSVRVLSVWVGWWVSARVCYVSCTRRRVHLAHGECDRVAEWLLMLVLACMLLVSKGGGGGLYIRCLGLCSWVA